MKERKTWTKQQDEILRLLKQVRGEKKWSAIAKKMEVQFSISGKSGKQCRQRYHNHLDSSIKQTQWTVDEQRVLFSMHDQVGNRWSVIANNLPGRTDNGVKNHFYSKLRKSVRRINKLILQNFKKEYKQIKTSLLYKIIQTSQSKFKVSSMVDQEVADFCTEIKNKLYYFQEKFIQTEQEHVLAVKQLIQDILNFGKNEKRFKIKSRKSSAAGNDLLHPGMCLSKVKSNSEYSSSQFSSKGVDSSSYCQESDQDQNVSIGHKSMNSTSKKYTDQTKSWNSTQKFRLTRSRSKDETFSSVKSPQCFSEDDNANAVAEDNFLSGKPRTRKPSFIQQKSQWSNTHQCVQQALLVQNVIQQKSSGSNHLSRNSHSNSNNRSHTNLFFEDSHFEMRILSPKNFAQQERMSEEEELFKEDHIEEEREIELQCTDNVERMFNVLGLKVSNFQLHSDDYQLYPTQHTDDKKNTQFRCFDSPQNSGSEGFRGMDG